jgi:hypothetical protein
MARDGHLREVVDADDHLALDAITARRLEQPDRSTGWR